MPSTRTRLNEQQTSNRQSSEIQTIVRKFGALMVSIGLLGFVGPAVWGNNDDGLVNIEPGLFLGEFAINGRHSLLHILVGWLASRASRDPEAARQYMGFGTLFFGAFAVIGWREFRFERGVHMIGGFALDVWSNVAHTVLAVFSFLTAILADSQQ